MTESTNFSSRFTRMESFIQQLQDEICQALDKKYSQKFQEDCWKRKEGGGGRTRVLENGSFLEKGGVNSDISKLSQGIAGMVEVST